MMTASTTTDSEPIGDFLALRGKRPNWRGPGHAWTRQRPARLTLSGHFGGLFRPKNPVSRKRRPSRAETRFECAFTAKEGRASRADEPIQPANRPGEQLPFHEGAGRLWPP